MATTNQMGIRRVVPRWRTFRDTLAAGELDPAETRQPESVVNDKFFEQKECDWKLNRDILFATDLVGASLVFGVTDGVKDAAKFLLQRPADTTPLALRVAAKVLGVAIDNREEVSEHQQFRKEIGKLKLRRTNEPRNAFVWADLARLYVLLGLSMQAKVPLRVALALAPHDRFIVRSAVRFHLHDGNPDEALDLLRRTERTKSDPWLMAAELAVSHVAGKSPKFFKKAEEIIEKNQVAPFHLSELLTAIASFDLWDGKNRRAKRLFTKSLIHPSENALAQTTWAARDVGLTSIPLNILQMSNASEARTLAAGNDGEWSKAATFAQAWVEDESFSARPYGFAASVFTSILGMPERGEATARAGLITNQNHPALMNNVAFALVSQGKAVEAKLELNKVSTKVADDGARICLIATEGLVEYRLGNVQKGKELYLRAIAEAEAVKNSGLKGVAQMYLAREEARLGNLLAIDLFKRGFKEVQKTNSVHNLAIAGIVQGEIEAFQKEP